MGILIVLPFSHDVIVALLATIVVALMATGLWDVAIPEACLNYVNNPSFETGTTGWSVVVSGTLARSTTRSAFGAYSLLVTAPGGSGDGAALIDSALTGATGSYTVSFYVWSTSTTMSVIIRDGGTIRHNAIHTIVANVWQRVVITGNTLTNGAAPWLQIMGTSGGSKSYYVDGIQIEYGDHETTYVDGDQPGGSWDGVPHASASRRSSSYRLGGRWRNLRADYGFRVRQPLGIGMPPVELIEHEQALLDGSSFQRGKKKGRTMQLVGQLASTTVAGVSTASVAHLHVLRQYLINAFNPDLVKDEQAVLLRYSGGAVPVVIECRYEGGLEQGENLAYIENPTIRLRASNPFWRRETDTGAVLGTRTTATTRYIAMKLDGAWNVVSLPSAVSTGGVYAIVRGLDGLIYLSGEFTDFNGITAADYIVKFNPATRVWSAVGTNAPTGPIYTLAVDAAGRILAGGRFATLVGGATARNAAVWNGTTWAQLGDGLGTGGTHNVYKIVVGKNGVIYGGGDFSLNGGGTINCYRIAQLAINGTIWQLVDNGFSDTVNGLAIRSNGNLVAIGTFTMSQDTTKTFNHVAEYNPLAVSPVWTAMSTGVPDITFAVAIGPDGYVYAAGTAGLVRVWNGTFWSALNGQATGTIEVLYFLADDTLVAGGAFTSMTQSGRSLATSGWAWWNGNIWYLPEIDFPAATVIWSMLQTPNGDLYVGLTTSSTSSFATETTVTNGGSAVSYPKITIQRTDSVTSATAILRAIRNVTKNVDLWFNTPLLIGETMTIDLSPDADGVVSSLFGSVPERLINPFDLNRFGLLPGANTLQVYVAITGTPTIIATAVWKDSFLSPDGVTA